MLLAQPPDICLTHWSRLAENTLLLPLSSRQPFPVTPLLLFKEQSFSHSQVPVPKEDCAIGHRAFYQLSVLLKMLFIQLTRGHVFSL